MLRSSHLQGFNAMAAGGSMPQFIVMGTGAQNTGSDTLAVDYPAGILANDIIWALAVARDTSGLSSGDTTITDISNFTQFGTIKHSAGDSDFTMWWKRATGSETGTETVTMSSLPVGTKSLTAVMFLFRSCILTGNPYEGGANASANSSATWLQAALTSLGEARLGIHMIGHTASATAGNFTGETNGDFTEAGIYTGTNATIQMQIASMPNPTTISGGSVTASAAAIHARQSLALLPAA